MQCALYFVFVVGTVEPHCVFRGGANYNIAPPPKRQPSRRIRNTNPTWTSLHKTALETRLEQQQQDLANTLSTLRSCQKPTTRA